jgi:hypothetical protein
MPADDLGMTALPAISLDDDWQYSTGNEDADWHSLPALEQWQSPFLAGDRLYLRRSVYLYPTEICVRYLLVLNSAPEDTDVFVNGWHVGTTRGDSFRANVTDQVTLEENVILLKVSQPGRFAPIYLQPIACE